MTREEFLAGTKLPPVPYTVDGLGDVHLKRFSGYERGQWDNFVTTSINKDTGMIDNPATYQAKLVVMTVCDATGKLLFTDHDIGQLLHTSGGALEEIFVASVKLNKLSRSEVAAAKANFTVTTQSETGTGSRGNGADLLTNAKRDLAPMSS